MYETITGGNMDEFSILIQVSQKLHVNFDDVLYKCVIKALQKTWLRNLSQIFNWLPAKRHVHVKKEKKHIYF